MPLIPRPSDYALLQTNDTFGTQVLVEVKKVHPAGNCSVLEDGQSRHRQCDVKYLTVVCSCCKQSKPDVSLRKPHLADREEADRMAYHSCDACFKAVWAGDPGDGEDDA